MILFYFSIFFFMIISILLCFIILIQESKSLGLGASFGGDSGDSVFGTATATILKKITAWLAIIFMVFCLILSFWSASIGSSRIQPVPTTIEE
jgi:preprotein translocase subunit SecG